MRRVTLATAAVAIAVAGCGGSDKKAETTATAAPAQTQTATATATAAPSAPAAISKNLKAKPKIPAPSGQPPAKLVVKDIVKGSGKKAKAGQTVSVQYVGVSWSTGQEFDASWDRGQPFSFSLGAGQVIPGWDQGVAGMRVGGRRELIIPPDLGYGAQGSPPAIAPNETLIFVVDLKKIG